MTDHDLLCRYAQESSQDAFKELVQRHVALVYSAARRQVSSPQLAEEVTQSVFMDLARTARHIRPDQPLSAWLYVVTRRTAIDVVRRESRRQAREQTAVEIAAMNSTPSPWPQIESLLDEAMASLNATDRTAILLRFFENKSLREVGAAIGASDDAAQKRVSRALDQLRAFFSRRGIAITAAGLMADLSAHAIEATPQGLTANILLAAHHSSTLAAAKAAAMTASQKITLAAMVALSIGGALFQLPTLFRQHAELQTLRQQADELAAQTRQARQRRDALACQRAAADQRLAALNSETSQRFVFDPVMESELRSWLAQVEYLKRLMAEAPEKTIPEMQLLPENALLEAVQRQDPSKKSESILSNLRNRAKLRFSPSLCDALRAYVSAHDGKLPSDVRELLPLFKDNEWVKAADVTPAMLQRYALIYSGSLSDVPADERRTMLVEITSSDEMRDQRVFVGTEGCQLRYFWELKHDTHYALRAFAQAHDGVNPTDAMQLLPYFNPPLSQNRQNKFLQKASSLLPRR